MLEQKRVTIPRERWDRIKELIDFRDVIEAVVDNPRWSSSAISCPFHGRDSTPSFTIYTGTNDAYCFGCPDGDQNWDHVKLVARTLEISKRKALAWLERHFNLPAWTGPANELEEDEDTPEVTLTTAELVEPYIDTVRTYARAHRHHPETPAELRRAISKFFHAQAEDDALSLARTIGRKQLRSIILLKESQ